ncbi:glycoside hydrolase family 64 protein [Xylariomycetidae sp. FL2044]|nr:glycoside hydrolase family 64 protein [Xylariomycetidae sp. FL2044]
MRAIFKLAVAAVGTLVTRSLAAPLPIVVSPGGTDQLVIQAHNTINATAEIPATPPTANASLLTVSLMNNFGSSTLNAYVTGQDSTGAVVMLTTDGTWYYPNPAGSGVPIEIEASAKTAIPMNGQGQTTEFKLPGYISSGRIWVADGELTFYTVASADGKPSLVEPSAVNPSDPSSAVNWGFVELTNTEEGGIYANISFVDFVGLVIGMELTLGSGETQTVQGLKAGAVEAICSEMKAQAAKDGAPWDEMCVTDKDGKALRILAPNMYVASNPDAMKDYYSDYVDQVWAKYTDEDLTIATQSDAGAVACRVSGAKLSCDGDNRAYPKPTTADIWGCNSGTFAILEGDNAVHRAVVPRLCAAFTRTTLLLADGGSVTPSLAAASYYQAEPTSHYSRIVHEYEVDGKGYAFSYDDVNPDGENEAGVVAGMNPQTLKLTVGGPL